MVKLKNTEAMILIFLSQVELKYRYNMYMSIKLQIEYNYLARILKSMVQKNWLQAAKNKNKVYYSLTLAGQTLLADAKLMILEQ